ncbi:MAG: hypothetical protein KF860_13470 [Cyclobacteriaceae bacterium]|nr:hypothetical protein [Cyclobacteriaceae bacterium]
MKKLTLILVSAAAITAFGFISYDAHSEKSKDENSQVIVIKGFEKSGYSESNTGSI